MNRKSIRKREILNEVRGFFSTLSPSKKDFFVCIYGSYATVHFHTKSDLDILVATEAYSKKDFNRIRAFVVGLHTKYGLTIDEEIPHKNKLLIRYRDIEDAIKLEPFISRKKYKIPPVTKDVLFLESRPVRLRLVLNALTTPHIFVCGNESRYNKFKEDSEVAITRLARALHGQARLNESQIVRTLLSGTAGETGQAHLGYKIERREVVEHLKEIVRRVLSYRNNG